MLTSTVMIPSVVFTPDDVFLVSFTLQVAKVMFVEPATMSRVFRLVKRTDLANRSDKDLVGTDW